MSDDLTDIDAKIAELEERRRKALAMGGEKKLAKRSNTGELNARERIEHLVDKDSFFETGLLGTSGVYPQDHDATPTDGKITGYARLDGRDISLVVNDFTVKGSSTSSTNSKKVGQVKRTGTERGMPIVFVGESTGARLPDAMGSRGMGALLGNDITQFQRMRDTPWAAAALGFSFGSGLCYILVQTVLGDYFRGKLAASEKMSHYYGLFRGCARASQISALQLSALLL